MKRVIIITLGIILLFSLNVSAEEVESEYIDLTEIEGYWYQLEEEFGQYVPTLNIREMLRGEQSIPLSIGELFKNVTSFLFREVVANFRLMGQLIILAVLAALLENLKSAFAQDTVAKLAQGVVFLVLFTIAINSFRLALDLGRGVIDNMIDTMQALIPLLLTLMAGMGSVTSVALFKPLVFLIVNLGSIVIKNVVFPMIFLATILYMVDNISNYKLNKLAGFLKDASMYILGFTLICFVGVTAIQGVGAAVVDGVGIKTGKFAAKVFIPVVGGLFADAFETVVGASLVLKSAVSVYGLVLVLMISIFPLIKIIAMTLIYRLTAAILQPLGDTPIVKTLETMGNCLTFMFIAVLASSVMYFMTLAIIMGAGNITQMIR